MGQDGLAAATRRYLRQLARHVSAEQWPTSYAVVAVAAALAADKHIDLPAPVTVNGAPVPAPVPSAVSLPDHLLPAAHGVDEWVLGAVHEHFLVAPERRVRGAHFTPRDVAQSLVAVTLADHIDPHPGSRNGVTNAHQGAANERWANDDVRLLADPTCGGGVFLLAFAEWFVARGASRFEAAARVLGADVDPLSVWVSRASLALWSGIADGSLDHQVVVADALDDPLPLWRGIPDAVIGNPPFQNQLARATVRNGASASRATELVGVAVPYADTAALFLVRSLGMVRDGGRVALIQPQSTMVARDAQAIRDRVLAVGELRGLWFSAQPVFAANVRVCAPVVERTSAPTAEPAPSLPPMGATPTGGGSATRVAPAVQRWVGRDFEPAASAAAPRPGQSWSALVSDLAGVPQVQLAAAGTLRDEARATAGFRDQYYGLVDAIREHDPARDPVNDPAGDPSHNRSRDVSRDATRSASGRHGPPHVDDDAPQQVPDRVEVARLVTTGLIDVLAHHWGHNPTRFNKVRYDAPVIDVARVDPQIAGWVRDQLVPKLLVATQSKVIEVVVDEAGDLLPSTPVIAVHTPPERLWHVAAALTAPCISAHAMAKVAGAALSADAIKMSATQTLDLPLPTDAAMWDRGADLARQVAVAPSGERRVLLERLGATMDAAYRCTGPETLAWWLSRLPGFDRAIR